MQNARRLAALTGACGAAQALRPSTPVRIFGLVEGDGSGTVGAVVAAPRCRLGRARVSCCRASIPLEERLVRRPVQRHRLPVPVAPGHAIRPARYRRHRPQESRSDALAGIGNIHPRRGPGQLPATTFERRDLRHRRCATAPATTGTACSRSTSAPATTRSRRSCGGNDRVAATYVNGAYMQAYFGVTPQQSGVAAATRSTAPARGWRDVRLNASVVYAIDALVPHRRADGGSLQNGARDSPIVFEPTGGNGHRRVELRLLGSSVVRAAVRPAPRRVAHAAAGPRGGA